MNKITSFSLLFILSIAVYPFQVMANSDPVNIKESVERTLYYSPLLHDKSAAYNKTDDLLKAAKAAYYPSIGIWAEGGFAQETSDTTKENETFSDVVTIGQVGANLNIPIWDGGKTSSLVKSEQSSIIASQYSLIDTVNTLALSAITAHADVLRYTQLVNLAKRNVNEHNAILRTLQQRLKDGLATRGEVDQVYGRLYSIEASLLAYEKGLYEAKASYTRLTGKEVPENLAGLSNPSYIYIDVEELQSLSQKNNYYLQKLNAEVDVYKNSQNAINSARMPNVYGSAGGSYATKDTSNTTNIINWSAMLNIEWELFNGGASKNRANAAKNEVLSAQYGLLEAKDALQQQVSVVFKHTTIAEEQAKLYSKASYSSRQARNNFQMQFELGRKDLLSVLDAETASFTAAVSNVVSTTDAIIGHYHMHALAGTLLQVLSLSSDINAYLK